VRRRFVWLAVVLFGVGSLVAGCTSARTTPSDLPAGADLTSSSGSAGDVHAGTASPSVAVAALRPGERWIDLPMPGGTYVPQAEAGGTDDYRCILLDPTIAAETILSGVVLKPGNPKLVHHAILYRVEPDQVAAAKAKDAGDPRLGWSCFGGPGLPGKSDVVGQLDSAPWVAAWATSGGEQRFAAGTGQILKAGSRLILQMHYNLLNGGGIDSTAVKLRVAPSGAHLQPLQTLLLPAPVELPCPANESGPLCNRDASVFDVVRRFGDAAGQTVAGLQLLCGGSITQPKAGPTQTCARPVTDTIQIRAVAGHMHLLGRSIKIDLERRGGSSQRLLDIKVWNFDDQRATVLAKPVTVHSGDKLRVTCTHDATLREKLPALAKVAPRYVVWGEGSSDEMCLGIVSYTKS
jgi:Copper type II ascorbate-dependent monooxygenase, C-terminal domain